MNLNEFLTGIGFFAKYPYTDFHELNLDWAIAEIAQLRVEFDNFAHVNSLKYAGEWDITKSYSAFSVVDDQGFGYMALKPVAPGTQITDTEFWLMIVDYSQLISDVEGRITALETTVGDASSGLVKDVDDLETIVGNASSGLVKDVDDLQADMTQAQNDIAALQGITDGYCTPQDFGAVGDGVTDDTAAVQAAINDGRYVKFISDYAVTHLNIPFDVTRNIVIDGKNFTLFYIGTGVEEAVITYKAVSGVFKNVKILNATAYPIPCIYWTSNSAANPSEFNKLDNITVSSFKTAIYYGDMNGVIDTSQSENYITGLKTRGCQRGIIVNMPNGIIHISESVLMVSSNEQTYAFDNSDAIIGECIAGVLNIVNCDCVKPAITGAYGFKGQNIMVAKCTVEIASPIAYCTGDVAFDGNTGGYYGSPFSSPFVVDHAATGVLNLNNYILRASTNTDSKLVAAETGYTGNGDYRVMISGLKLTPYRYTTLEPFCDYPVTITESDLGVLVNPVDFEITSKNSSDMTITDLTESTDADGNMVFTSSSNPYANAESVEFECGSFVNMTIEVKSMVGTWSYGFNTKDNAGTLAYPRGFLQVGINNMTMKDDVVKSFTAMFQSTAIGDEVTISKIRISAQAKA